MSQPINSILLPTDGSDGAQIGARRGIDLATTIDADLHVLSAVDTRDTEPDLQPDGQTERERLLMEEAERAVDTTARLARAHLSGQITTAVEAGIPFQAINDYVDTHDIDLIVMGTQGRTGFERVVLGSVAEKTLRTAAVPIVMVPPDADIVEIGDQRYEDILLPTDGSEGATLAIEWGITLAEMYDATIHTLYSVDTSRFGGVDGAAEIHDTLEQTGQEALETVHKRSRDAGVSVAGNIASGPAARAILSYSEDHDIDLIAMGTHGQSGFTRYLTGSVTETVVRNASVPVCCVPMQ
ncbi:Nucleotide-binding universal stress protein, UspA family [Haloarcula vallismortis]|uniref:Universal stress protein n=2 Tax=Haloarcula vallismortis TaxID=28442 RepID=M0IW33_HALVA|nr:universal stress protein [Haloarcula vallismortis]EMA01052.1 universal stress protein [Haloarcula vallismortis ATCC 29715]SDW13930.1 Nucleotide-binding universal stress protein, UspA family [Haloarcula vallismortis]